VAASGGYYISCGCTKIVAQPSTITGSIGVVSMLPDLSRAVSDLGINVETVSRGPLGDQLALMKHGPTDVIKNTITLWMEEVYRDFAGKVAKGRGLPIERVHELALPIEDYLFKLTHNRRASRVLAAPVRALMHRTRPCNKARAIARKRSSGS